MSFVNLLTPFSWPWLKYIMPISPSSWLEWVVHVSNKSYICLDATIFSVHWRQDGLQNLVPKIVISVQNFLFWNVRSLSYTPQELHLSRLLFWNGRCGGPFFMSAKRRPMLFLSCHGSNDGDWSTSLGNIAHASLLADCIALDRIAQRRNRALHNTSDHTQHLWPEAYDEFFLVLLRAAGKDYLPVEWMAEYLEGALGESLCFVSWFTSCGSYVVVPNKPEHLDSSSSTYILA